MPKEERIQIRLDAETKRAAEKVAAADYRTLSEWIRMLIMRELPEQRARAPTMKPTTMLGKKIRVTLEGGPAAALSEPAPPPTLRRNLSALEDTFYEDGQSIFDRICALVSKAKPEEVAALAAEARNRLHLRHVPLLLCRELARAGQLKPETLALCLQRADEPAQFLALLWEGRKHFVPHAVRKGIALAVPRFSEYQLAKWGRSGPITMRDVLRMARPKPTDAEQAALWGKVIKGELATPDTWEVALSSAGKDADKHALWTRLLTERVLPAMALLRNLRNMARAGAPKALVAVAMQEAKFDRVLPFRFLSAARAVPQWEDLCDAALLAQKPARVLPGKTVLLVDVSGSMAGRLSGKSDLTRLDAACGVAILAREMCEAVSIYTFANELRGPLPPRRGMALRDAIGHAAGGTYLGHAIAATQREEKDADRLVVLTDEQAHDAVDGPWATRGYLVNVAPYEHGVGRGRWLRVDGWSEAVLDFICEEEGLTVEATAE